MTAPKIRITGEWKAGKVRLGGGLEEVRIYADGGKQHGEVTMVFERGRGKFFFRGIERAIDNPRSEFAGDLPMIFQSMGWESVPKATWKRIYDADHQRRLAWDQDD